jgi:signal transduction histidine kinase
MRILIVDDDAKTLEVIAQALATHPGYEIETASSGLEGVCRVLIGDIDLVISPWQMEGMSGPDLCRNIRKSGMDRYVYVVLITAQGAAENVVEGLAAGADEFVVQPVDATELMARVWSIQRMKNFNDELRKRNRDLEDSHRFRTDWIDMVVGAIRSPMSSIVGFTELAASKASPRLKEHIETVRREVRWVDTMLKQMLVVARSEDGRLRPSRARTNLLSLANSSCKSLNALAGSKSVRLVVFCPQGEFLAELDAPLMQGALDNLLANAIRHSPADSSVVVELRMSGDDILVAVTDQGPGVPPELRPSLFERYTTLPEDPNPAASDPCLGLAYCHAVAVAHEGQISYGSNQPSGARFEMRIPATGPTSNEEFDPAAFAAALASDGALAERKADDSDIEDAIDSRLVLFAQPDSSLPC